MKYVLVLLVVLLVLWLIGGRRRRADKPPSAPPKPPGTAMIACVHCGLHLPEQEALRDAAGHAYCGEEHRRLGAR